MDQATPTPTQKSPRRFFEEAPLYLLYIATFLLPILARGNSSIPTEYLKSGFLFIITALSVCVFGLVFITKRTFSFLKHPLIWSAGVVVVVTLISALLSGTVAKTFFGNGFETGTFFGLLSMMLVFFFTATYARKGNRIFTLLLLLSVATSLSVLALLVTRIFGASFLGLESLSMTTAGIWTTSALFFGVMTLMQGVLLELAPMDSRYKKIVMIGFALSFLGFIFTDFALAWWIVGVVALAYTAYRLFFTRDVVQTFFKFTWFTPTLLIIIFTAVFLIFGGDQSGLSRVMEKVVPTSLDARPTWTTTLHVAKETWKQDPLFGVGPNRFGPALTKNKPVDINMTPFWGVDFGAGVGYVPTVLVTGGIVGSLAWLIFICMAVFYAARLLFTKNSDRSRQGIGVAVVFGLVAGWAALFAFVPGVVLLFFAFLCMGILVALVVGESDNRVITRPTDTKTVFGFAAMAILVVVVLGSITLEYIYIQKGRALAYSGEAVFAISQNNFSSAASLFEKAVQLSTYDGHLRGLVEAKIADLTLRINGGLSPAQIEDAFSREYPAILASAEQAVVYDEDDYLNWVTLGTTYQMALSLGIANAYERALSDFEQALSLNPHSPGVYLGLARLELTRNNFDAAKARLDEALNLKPDYIEALYLHSQIAVRTGKTEEAISRAINAAAFSPDNASLLFQLGLLYYTNKNFTEAAAVLERVSSLRSDFPNTYYYLGLTYYVLGKEKEARAQFEQLRDLNPENVIAQGILKNLDENRDPLYGVVLTGADLLPTR